MIRSALRALRRCARRSCRLRWIGRGRCRQISLVPQLEDGRVGMVGKIHHSLVDGLAALQIVNLILDPEPDVVSQPPAFWEPRGLPGRIGWARDVVTRTFADGVDALRAGATAATRPSATG